MLHLIFFTTNNVKLAHARYLAEEYPLKVEGFRQKTYHASYNEPRIKRREKLLESSYKSALVQARKANINFSRQFFFLEDTSVKIDALSNPRMEVPGVDVKYWMREQSFDSLDKLLKERGNNRKVTIRSDILLHVPDQYKQRWGLKKPYIVFTGYQDGVIAKKNFNIETNLVFPWLDDKTFNKWFVPSGASVPISLLTIDEANKFDFRRHAFTKMVDFLIQGRMLSQDYPQTCLALDLPRSLIVCGYPCSGKTTISQFLVNKHGYMHIEASDFMYLNYYLRQDVASKVKIADFAEKALIEKPEIAAEKIAEYMEEISNFPIIISGFRSENEIQWLKSYFLNRKNFEVFFIQTKQKIRHKRFNRRGRNGKQLSLAEFRTHDVQQKRMGLNEIPKDSEVRKIKNENTLLKFYATFEKLALPNENNSEVRALEFSVFQNFPDLKLEEAILMALLIKWENKEDRAYFTTTQIAKIIRENCPRIKPKHKDNVSRYFNQDFYAFYEIDSNPDATKRKYRLSNTGYGKAVKIYYQLINDPEKHKP